MKKDTHKKEGMSTGTVVAIGAGVAALATASYFFLGPNGKKNRTAAKGWMIKMKGEIVDKLEDAQEVTEAVYHKIVDTVAAQYLKGSKAGAQEVTAFADMLKSQWKGISKLVSGTKSRTAPKKAAKKPAKKVTTKTVKKAPAKTGAKTPAKKKQSSTR